jgi:RHS repeat-associated protein
MMLCCALVVAACAVQAQNIQFTQGSVGPGLDHILQIPLRAYPGRGQAGLPVTLYYSSRVWRIGHLNTVNQQTAYQSIAEAIYAEYSKAGWRSSLDIPVIEWPKQTDTYYYSGGPFCFVCGSSFRQFRVARLYLHMPDGSTHEMRKGDQPYEGPVDMFGTFYAVDGSRFRYDSTGESTGTLYLPDGTRYILNGSTAQYIDRNGNTLNYNASTGQWTDTMGRVIGIPLPASPQPQDYTYTLPGINGTTMSYTFRWKYLSDALTPNPTTGQLPVRKPIANEYLPNPSQPPTNSSGGNYPQTIQPSYSERPSLFITDGSDDSTAVTIVVGHNQNGAELFNPVVLTEIVYPNGLSYKFTYNIYGEIDKVVYPTGAFERYEYTELPYTQIITPPYSQANRAVTKRQLSASGSGNDLAEWQYALDSVYQNTGVPVDALRITTTMPDQTRTEVYKYHIRPPVHGRNNSPYWSFGYEDARQGLAFEERAYAAPSQGGAMLRRKLIQWERTTNPVPPRIGLVGEATETAYRNPRPVKDVSMILDMGGDALTKTMTYLYDTTYQLSTGLDLTNSTEYFFASVDQTTAQTGAMTAIPSGTLASSSETTYLNDQNYRDRNFLGLETSVIIRDPGGQPVSKTVIAYDETALLTYYDFGNDWTEPGAYRGNVTTVRRYVDASAEIPLGQECPAGVCLDRHSYFDQVGNIWKTKNERGIESQMEFGATYKHAYSTLAQSAVADPSGAHGSNSVFTSSSVYDYDTGLILSTTDANGQTTSYSYRDDQNAPDALIRLRKVSRPDGGWTKFTFNDVPGNLYTLTETRQDATHSTIGYQFFDALGRPSRAFMLESGTTYLANDTEYDPMGHVLRVSNPYRQEGLGGAVNPSGLWTTSQYDALGRVKTVTMPDGTSMQTAYQGIYIIVTDQAGKQRRQKVDSLGRIVRVDEPNAAGQLGTLDAPTQPTYYDYDTQGNLVHIQQGTGTQLQHRYFKYDALSRLTYERQVEQAATITAADSLTNNSQWSRKLTYDETINGISYQGLQTGMTDARGVVTQYSYDNLDRLYQVSYSDGTPTLTNIYDQAHTGYFNKGRRTSVSTSAAGIVPATSQSYDYDLMGRVQSHQQVVGANVYALAYAYDLSGQLKSETYPSGRVVANSYDDTGRLSGVTSGGQTYASNFAYGPKGALTSVTYGNGATQTFDYNDRLQLTALSLIKDSATIQRYEYKYGKLNVDGTVDETKNNGQIARIEGFIGTSKQWQQRFSYDDLGRLTQSSEYRGDNNQQSYLINYGYDQFGNRYQYLANNQGALGYVAVEDSDISKTTNRFTFPQITYDNAGNITVDGKFRQKQYQYDANNRQKWAALTDGTGAATSVYDGTGQRVATITDGVTKVLVYDAMGKLVAEYGAAPTGTNGRQYVFADHLGSTRVVTNQAGGVVARHDYQPFGEEIFSGTGMRAANQGYDQADNVRQKYAGMERDEASGMAHTLWRKYDGLSGRWTSPDPYGGSADITNPQTINRYTYVNNDPVNQTDPDGLSPQNQHRFITFLMAAMLGYSQKDARDIAQGAGDADSFWHAATGLGGLGAIVNLNQHFGKPKTKEQLLATYRKKGGNKLGRGVHLVEDNAPNGPHQLTDCGHKDKGCYGLANAAKNEIAHARAGHAPDLDSDNLNGWAEAWKDLSYVRANGDESAMEGLPAFPAEIISFILHFVNDNHLDIIGVQYIAPDGTVHQHGEILDPSRHILIGQKVINGNIVNIYIEKQKEKKPPKEKPKKLSENSDEREHSN